MYSSHMDKSPIIQRLDALLGARDWNIADLARAADRKYHEIYPWWRKPEPKPSGAALLAVADALGVTTEFLLTGERDPESEDRRSVLADRLRHANEDELPLLESYFEFLLSKRAADAPEQDTE